MLKNFERATIIYFIYAVALSWLFFIFARVCYFSDSEIWLLTLSQKVFNIQEVVTIYYKLTFHALIYLFSHRAPTEVDVYLWARTGCAVVAILSLLVTTYIFTGIFKNRRMFFPLLIFLLSASLFFNQGFRIRADIFAYFVHLMIVWFIFSRIDKKITWRDHIITIALNFLLLTLSPKIVYFFIAQFILFLLFIRLTQSNRKQFSWLVWQSHFLCLCAVTLGSVASYFIPGAPNVPYVLALALDFYVQKFDPILFTPGPWSTYAFFYLTNFLWSNFFHTLAYLITLAFVVSRILGLAPSSFSPKDKALTCESQIQSAFGVYGFVLFLLALLHNDKLPFFLAPMLVPISAYCFLFVVNEIESRYKKYFHTALVCILSILCYRAFSQYELNEKMNTNYFQLLAVKTLDRYKEKYPGVKVYDVIGLLPRKNDIYAFAGPGEEKHKDLVIDQLKREKPDLLLYTFKALLLEPQLTEYLMQNMIPLEKDVWAKGVSITFVRNFNFFQRVQTFGKDSYWIMPAAKEKYVYDITNNQIISGVVLRLDKNLKPTTSDAVWMAIPQRYLALGFSDFAPLTLLHSPADLFRFDTGF